MTRTVIALHLKLPYSRSQIMAALSLVASANGLAPPAINTIISDGWFWALSNTFGTSIIVWGAWIAACHLALTSPKTGSIRYLDLGAIVATAFLIAIPSPAFSWLALSFLSTYWLCTSEVRSLQRRSAAIFLAICVPMFWGPLLMRVAAHPVLDIDAFLVAKFIGAKQIGNIVTFSGGKSGVQIWPGCSSFHNISQAGLAWIALSQSLGRELGVRDLLWTGLAVGSAALVNLVRISLMVLYPAHFETLHGPIGEQIAGLTTLLLIVVICMSGQRRDLFATA